MTSPTEAKQLNNGQITKLFFKKIHKATKSIVLDNIAAHYGIDRDAALAEVTHDEAEHLLEYMREPERALIHDTMKIMKLTPATIGT